MQPVVTVPALCPGLGPRWRFVAAVIVSVWLGAPSAWAITVRDIIELSRAGVSDEVLVELIAMDESVFHLAPSDLLQLKAAGVSDRVVIAMLQSARAARERREMAEARMRTEALQAAEAAQSVVVGEETNRAASRRAQWSEPVVVPVLVPVPVIVQQIVEVDRSRSRRAAASDDSPRPLHSRPAATPDVGGESHVRSAAPEKKAHWIVNTAGWIVK